MKWTSPKPLLVLLVLAGSLSAGLWAGPMIRSGYDHLFPPPAYETGDFSALQSTTGKPVIAFTTSTCPYCRQAREYLERMDIAYEDYVIDKSGQAMRLYETLHEEGVPILIIGDRKIIGFHEDAIQDALQATGTIQE